MPKRSRKPDDDPNRSAFDAVTGLTRDATDHIKPTKNPAAQALGRLGGLKGGKARAQKLSPEERAAIAKAAAQARWEKPPEEEQGL